MFLEDLPRTVNALFTYLSSAEKVSVRNRHHSEVKKMESRSDIELMERIYVCI